MREHLRLPAQLLLLGALWILPGCHPPERARMTTQTPVCLLDTGPITTEGGAWHYLVLQLYPEASVCSEQALNQLSPEDRQVVLIPDCANVPACLWQPIEQALNRGVPMLFLGREPFHNRTVLTAQGAETAMDRLQRLLAQARNADALLDIAIWSHINDSQALRGRVLITDSPVPGWPAVQVDVEHFSEWDFLEGRVNPEAWPTSANTLCFYARGSATTSRMVVEAYESDGSHWGLPVALASEWQPFALNEKDFICLSEDPKRGGDGDHLHLSQTQRLRIGLHATRAPQPPGEHRFSVSDVRIATTPPGGRDPEPPRLPMLHPESEYFSFSADEFVAPSGNSYTLQRARLQSPAGPWRSRTETAPARWYPLGRAQGALDQQGWPVSLWMDASGPRLRSYGWIATDPGGPARDLLPEMLQQATRQLKQNAHLLTSGTGAASCTPEDLLELRIRWAVGSEQTTPLRLAAELLDENGHVLRRVNSPQLSNLSPGLQDLALNIGRAPAVSSARRFRIRTQLEEAAGNGRVLDEMEHSLTVLPPPPLPEAREQITCSGGRFFYRRAPVFMLGLQYEPDSGCAAEHWLEPQRYDADAVRRDLDRYTANGLNALAITYTALSQTPQLLDLFEAARKRGLWIYLRVPAFNPLNPDLTTGQALIQALDLARHPEVFALDLAGPFHAITRPPLVAFDQLWLDWVLEQYGSVEHAEQVLGHPLWRDNQGNLTHPPPEQLKNLDANGTIAYRRFTDDLISRRVGQAVRLIRDLGCPQLITARTGFLMGESGPVDRLLPAHPAACATHLDFMSPCAGFLHGTLDSFYEAGFLAAYTRGMSAGKPLLWMDFASDVGRHPAEVDLQNQARVFRNMFELVDNTVAAGCMGQVMPGRRDPEARTDIGLLSPSGVARPALILHREMLHRQRQTPLEIQSWKGRTLSAETQTVSQLWDQWRDLYRKETALAALEELRPEDFSTLSTQFDKQGPGGLVWADPAPMKSLNSEWGHAHSASAPSTLSCQPPHRFEFGQLIDLELINTGPMTWVKGDAYQPGSVFLNAKGPDSRVELIPLPQTAFGQSTHITWRPTAPGPWTLRAQLNGYGEFGERLSLTVTAP